MKEVSDLQTAWLAARLSSTTRDNTSSSKPSSLNRSSSPGIYLSNVRNVRTCIKLYYIIYNIV